MVLSQSLGYLWVYERTHFFNDYCAFSRSFLTSLHSTLSTILPPEPPKENKTNTDTTLKNDRVDLIKRISKSDIWVGRNWILFWRGKKVFLTGKKKEFLCCASTGFVPRLWRNPVQFYWKCNEMFLLCHFRAMTAWLLLLMAIALDLGSVKHFSGMMISVSTNTFSFTQPLTWLAEKVVL